MTHPEGESDAALAAQAAAGHRASFEILLHRYKDLVFRFIRRYVGTQEDAYDIVQEVFLAAWLNLRRYDRRRLLLPWLYTIALNRCRDHARRQKVRRLLLLDYASQSERQNATASGSSEVETVQQQRLRRLDIAIASLPSFYKEPLLLVTISGLSHQEAADLLKTTAKAIEMRLRRARKKLANEISRAERDG